MSNAVKINYANVFAYNKKSSKLLKNLPLKNSWQANLECVVKMYGKNVY